jgi:hypothetical protein
MSSNPREERFIISPQIRTIPSYSFSLHPENEPLIARNFDNTVLVIDFLSLYPTRNEEMEVIRRREEQRRLTEQVRQQLMPNSWIELIIQNNNHKSEEDIKKLFTDNAILMGNNVECSICYENDCDYQTNCEHNYCKECIEKWLLQNNTCPNCRQEIKECNKISVVDID